MRTFYKAKSLLFTGILAFLGSQRSYAQLALDLGGPGNNVQGTYALNTTGGFTIEYDMYLNSLTALNGGLTFTCGNVAHPVDFYINTAGIANLFTGDCFGFSPLSTGSLTFSAGNWYRIAITYDTTGGAYTTNFYVDGVLLSSYITGSPLPSSAASFIIGDRSDGVTNADAAFDNVLIWSYPRSASQIAGDVGACVSGTEPGLDVFYPMDEGTGTTLFDYALGNGAQNGTITGSFGWTGGVDNSSTSTLSVVECMSYTSPSGNYTWTTSGTYMDTIPNARGCDSIMTIELGITTVADQTVNAAAVSICAGDSTTISITSSEANVFYTLRDNSDNSVVDGPVAGNGSGISFNTGAMSSTTTYNVLASNVVGAVDLPGNNDYVQFTSPYFTYGNEITVESWVNFDGTAQAWAGQSLQNVDNSASNVWLWHFGSFLVNYGGVWRSLNFPTTVPTGWIHVATVANPACLSIYYNGVLVAYDSTASGSSIVNNPFSTIFLGQDPRFVSDPGRNSDVAFDNFTIWSSARTQPEVMSDMNTCLTGTETNLVQYTQFSEKSGTALNSLAGSGGTIVDPSVNWITGSGVCDWSCDLEMSNTIAVTVLNPTSSNQTASACASYTWNGNTYSASGAYMDTIPNAAGCDSVMTLNLTIDNIDLTVTDAAPTLTANQTGAVYQWVDCGTAFSVISGQTAQSYTATNNGNYAVIVTNGSCTDTTSCVNVMNAGIDEVKNENMRVYPNPSKTVFYIELENASDQVKYTVAGADGRVVCSAQTQGTKKIILDLSREAKGMYILQVVTDRANQQVHLVLE